MALQDLRQTPRLDVVGVDLQRTPATALGTVQVAQLLQAERLVVPQLPIYLDNNSTTRVDPRVVDMMVPFFGEHYGNASSKHHEFGWKAEAAVEAARKQVAALIHAEGKEVIFTSGATESINLALKGIAESYAHKGNHIITAATEHKAVLDSCKRLEKYGFRVTVLPVDRDGLISPHDLSKAIDDKTILVTIMIANNEIGTINPISELAAICRRAGRCCATVKTHGSFRPARWAQTW